MDWQYGRYVCEKFYYDRLRIDKALGNFRRSDNNQYNNKNNVHSAWGSFPGPKRYVYTISSKNATERS